MEWYYMENGQRVGPVSDGEFEGQVQAGTIRPDTPVWRKGMANWARFSAVRPAAAPAAAPAGVAVAEPAPAPAAEPQPAGANAEKTCSLCGKAYAADALIRYKDNLVCWSCKPAFLQRLKEGAGVPGTFSYAGFWCRFGAKIIDGILLGIAGFAVNMLAALAFRPAPGAPPDFGRIVALQGFIMVLSLGLGAGYSSWFLGKHGATPGKMALGIKVVLPDGRPVSYAKGFGRYFAEMVSSILLGIGYLMAAFDEEKRALHDRICDTRVVRK